MAHQRIGLTQQKMGALSAAQASMGRARSIQQALVESEPRSLDRSDRLAGYDSDRGRLLLAIGRKAEALSVMEQAGAIRLGISKADPGAVRHKLNVARAHANVAEALRALGRTAEARDALRQAVTLGEALVRKQPGETEPRAGLAYDFHCLGNSERVLPGRPPRNDNSSRKSTAWAEGNSVKWAWFKGRFK